jgi:hypothetical protein
VFLMTGRMDRTETRTPRGYHPNTTMRSAWLVFQTHRKGPVKCPTVEDFYLVSSFTEVAGLYQDIDAHSLLEATRIVLNVG